MSDCGCSGTWIIVWNTPINGTNTDFVSGFKNDNPHFGASVKYANCPHGLDLISSCDGKVMYAGWTCNTPGLQLINATFEPGPDCSSTYDCINGNCIDSSTYKTPGYFKTLTDCQSACGLVKGCSGICIGNDEYQKIQGLINKISGEIC